MKLFYLFSFPIILFICSIFFSTGTSNLDSPNVNEVRNIDTVSKILFSKKSGNERGWSVFSINSDGSDQKVLIPFKSGQGEYNPEISPDGKTILFNTYRYGGWKLALFNLTDESVTRVASSSNYYYNGAFSPDGNEIVYERNIQRDSHIFKANKNGENETLITSGIGKENRVPVWSPDGTQIFFYSEHQKKNDIYSFRINTGVFKNLTENNSGNNFNPAISPDGKKIAFFSDRNGFLDLYTMNSDGTNQKNLTVSLQSEKNSYNYYEDANMFWLFKASWSPEGNEIVFSNVENDNIDLFIINSSGKDLINITNSPQSELTPVWGILNY